VHADREVLVAVDGTSVLIVGNPPRDFRLASQAFYPLLKYIFNNTVKFEFYLLYVTKLLYDLTDDKPSRKKQRPLLILLLFFRTELLDVRDTQQIFQPRYSLVKLFTVVIYEC